jgi:hypothetical protein
VAKAQHVEPQLACHELDRGAIDLAVHDIEAVAHRAKPPLRRGGERGLRGQRVVFVEWQRAMHELDLSGIEAHELIERDLRADAVAARVIAPHHDRDRRVRGAFGRARPARHVVDRGGIELELVGDGRSGEQQQREGKLHRSQT